MDEEKTTQALPTAIAPEVHHDFPTGRSFFIWATTGLIGILLVFAALSFSIIINPELKVGDIADKDLVANRSIKVVDEQKTNEAREKVRHNAMPVMKTDPSADESSLKALQVMLDGIKSLQKGGLTPPPAELNLTPEKYVATLNLDDAAFSKESQLYLPSLNAKGQRAWQRLQQSRASLKLVEKQAHYSQAQEMLAAYIEPANINDYVEKVSAIGKRIVKVFQRITVEDRETWREVVTEFLPSDWKPAQLKASAELISSVLEPNMAIDEEATYERTEKLASQVEPIYKEIPSGEVVVRHGQAITARHLTILRGLGKDQINRLPLLVSLLVSLLTCVAFEAVYLYQYEPKLLFSSPSIGLMYSVTFVAAALSSAVGRSYPQFVPLPAAALVLTIFFGKRIACSLVIPTFIILYIDRVMTGSALLPLVLASLTAISAYNRHRNAVIRTATVMSVMQALGFIITVLLTNTAFTNAQILKGAVFSLLGGLSSAIVAIGSLPFFENIFGLVTPFRLAELTDADQPLLRKLEENAPGTYQHSLAVANLAEAGARAIQGDVNLVRAGALYHDIGKMVRPRYFIENQLGDKNPHDSLTPEESRERVLAHVNDGLALAQKYSLPKAVQDFIPMHQGTCLMAYFYHKACVRDGVDKVDASFYRYPGPKPQSKETAIVMLADVSEAVTHSMSAPSEQEVDEAIDKVFKNRFEDGQFNESGLSPTELKLVQKAFVRVWRTLHHERLKYPSTTTGKMPIAPESIKESSN